MVAIEANDLAQRLHYIIVGIEVAKEAINEIENEECSKLSQEYIAAELEEQLAAADTPTKTAKKTSRPKKVKR